MSGRLARFRGATRPHPALVVSTGIRFSTVPSTGIQSHPASPPTTLTLLYNPLMGFLSTAYSAQISPHLALSSRYGVNVYSYESDLCVGGEWWIGSGRGKGGWRGLRGVMGEDPAAESVSTEVGSPNAERKPVDGGETRSFMQAMRSHTEPVKDTDRDGVLKAKIQGNGVSRAGPLADQTLISLAARLLALRIAHTKVSCFSRRGLGSVIALESHSHNWNGSAVLLGLETIIVVGAHGIHRQFSFDHSQYVGIRMFSVYGGQIPLDKYLHI